MKFYEIDLNELLPHGIPLNTESHVEYTNHINEFFLRGFEKWYKQLFATDNGELLYDYSRSCAAPASIEACQFCTDAQLEYSIKELGFAYYPTNDHNINAEFFYNLNNMSWGTLEFVEAITHYLANTDDLHAEVLPAENPFEYSILFSGDVTASVNTTSFVTRLVEHLKVISTAHTRLINVSINDVTDIETYAGVTATDIEIKFHQRMPNWMDLPNVTIKGDFASGQQNLIYAANNNNVQTIMHDGTTNYSYYYAVGTYNNRVRYTSNNQTFAMMKYYKGKTSSDLQNPIYTPTFTFQRKSLGQVYAVIHNETSQNQTYYRGVCAFCHGVADIVKVYDEELNYFSAFRKNLYGTYWYYVLDDVNMYWTNELSLIGYTDSTVVTGDTIAGILSSTSADNFIAPEGFEQFGVITSD